MSYTQESVGSDGWSDACTEAINTESGRCLAASLCSCWVQQQHCVFGDRAMTAGLQAAVSICGILYILPSAVKLDASLCIVGNCVQSRIWSQNRHRRLVVFWLMNTR